MKNFWDRIPKAWRHIFGWFFASRIILTIAGVLARRYLANGPVPWNYSKYAWLAVWGVWDSGWYLHIAQFGYSAAASIYSGTVGQASYAFFPLYPLLMKLLEPAARNYFFAGWLISNAALILAAVYWYRLVRLDEDEQTSLRAAAFLFLYPAAFIFSGVFSESLFLLLVVASLYSARRRQWWRVGLWSNLASLTRVTGVLLLLPLLLEFYWQYRTDVREWLRRGWALLGGPLGLAAFAAYNKYLTGSFFSFLAAQTAWHRQLQNPLRLIYGAALARDPYNLFASAFALAALGLLLAGYRRLRFSYWLFGVLVILLPMFSGLESLPRYTLAAFPLFLVLARLTDNKLVRRTLFVGLGALQLVFMAVWTLGLIYMK